MQADIKQNIKKRITDFDPDAEVILFGSRARGDFQDESDWDVLVVSPKNKITIDYEKAIREPILDLELETGQVISLIVYTKHDWQSKMHVSPLFMTVSREGIRL